MTDPSPRHGPAPTELELVLAQLGRQRFVFHEFDSDRHESSVVAAVHGWGEGADVLIVFDEYHACAFRTPMGVDADGNEIDVLDPAVVYVFPCRAPVGGDPVPARAAAAGAPGRTHGIDQRADDGADPPGPTQGEEPAGRAACP